MTAASTDSVQEGSGYRTTLFFLLIGYIGYYLCRNNLSSAFPLMSVTFGLSNSQLGLIAFYSELVYALGKFLTGPMADHYGGKGLFLLGMVGAVVFNVLFSFGKDLNYFILIWCGCRFFLSMGWGGLIQTVTGWTRRENYGHVMGILSLSFQFGGAIATLFTGVLVSRGAPWGHLFLYPALILSVLCFLCFLFIKEAPGADDKANRNLIQPSKQSAPLKTFKTLGVLFRQPPFWGLLLFSFFLTFLRSISLVWIPKFLVDQGMGNSQAIINSTLFPLLGALSTILLGRYTDKIMQKHGNRVRVLIVMLLLLCLCFFFTGQLIAKGHTNTNFPLIVFLMACSGFFLLGPYSMLGGCLSLDIGGVEASGTCSGFVDGMGYFGGALAIWFAGVCSDKFGWDMVYRVLGIVGLLSALSAYTLSTLIEANSAKTKKAQLVNNNNIDMAEVTHGTI